MARTVFTDENSTEEEKTMSTAKELVEMPRVKQFVRYLGAMTTETATAIQEVDEEINAWLAQGYKLLATHYVEHNTVENTFGVLYILLRE